MDVYPGTTGSRVGSPAFSFGLGALRLDLSPAALVALFSLAQILAWTLTPLVAHIAMPLDVVEGIYWGQEWQLGYYKHPPLPAWLVGSAFELLGDVGPYLLSQLAIASTYWAVYLIGRDLMDERRAAVGTLLLAGVFYFSWPTPEFNHNVAQMPAWAWATFFYLRAFTTNRWVDWLGLGGACAVAVLTKYTVATLFVPMAALALARPQWRQRLLSWRAVAAVAIGLALAAPHLVWLVQNDFLPFAYAESRAVVNPRLGGVGQGARFLLVQLADHLGLVLLLFSGGLLSLRRREAAVDAAGDGAFVADRSLLTTLLVLGVGPALTGVALCIIMDAGIRDMWGAPMWNLSGLLAVAVSGAAFRRVSFRGLVAGVSGLLVVVPLAYAAVADLPSVHAKTPRFSWPDGAIATAAEQIWAQAAPGCPLRIVAGDQWLPGLVSVRASARPAVMVDGSFRTSPWITPERLRREGALLVWDASRSPEMPEALASLPGAHMVALRTFVWPRGGRGTLRIGFGTVLAEDAGCSDTPTKNALP